jgi:formamidopyrimidine-DNA glycosylase
MPELPEVETIRRGLQKQIVGKTISKIIIKKPNLVKQSGKSFRKELVGKQFGKIDRVGKLLIFTVIQSQNRVDDTQTDTEITKRYLLIHLKMTGQLVYCDDKSFVAGGHANSKKEEEQFMKGKSKIFCKPGRFTHIIFDLKEQHRGKTSMFSRLFFNDMRQFGTLKVVNEEELKEIKNKYGIEPGRPNFTFRNFQKALQVSEASAGRGPTSRRRDKGATGEVVPRGARNNKKKILRKANIKAILLNQSIISGLGNIYVDESLFASKIHPQRPANSLIINEQKRLFNAIKRIIKLAIKNNGTTFSDFIDSKGQKGNFKQKLKVYGRQNQLCLRCQNNIEARPLCSKQKVFIQKIKVAGRGTHFCERCQK